MRHSWPFDLQTTLGLGVRLEPEQVWMYEQAEGRAMAIWTVEDPVHALECTEGCGMPLGIDMQPDGTGTPLVIPTPVRYDLNPINEMEVEQDWGENWAEWPSMVVTHSSEYHPASYECRPVRLWDLWPITSTEWHALRGSQDSLFERLALNDITLLAEFEGGDLSAYEYIENHTDLIDPVRIEKYWETEDEAGQMAYLEEVYEDFMTMLGERITLGQNAYTSEVVRAELDLRAAGLSVPWKRLQSVSQAAWKTVANSCPPSSRDVYMRSQKWIMPWY